MTSKKTTPVSKRRILAVETHEMEALGTVPSSEEMADKAGKVGTTTTDATLDELEKTHAAHAKAEKLDENLEEGTRASLLAGARHTFGRVPLDDLVWFDNIRSLRDLQIPLMVRSYRQQQGYDVSEPITVNRRDDGSLVVLRGNRRTLGALWLRDHAPDEYARFFPDGTIPAIIYEGLNEKQEIAQRIDHGKGRGRVELGEWSQFLAVKQLMRAGFTQTEAATHLDMLKTNGQPNRQWIQPRYNLARMPLKLQEEYRKFWEEGKDATPLRVQDIAELYKAFHAEQVKHPNGGPQYRQVLANLMAGNRGGDGSKGKNTGEGKTLTPTDVRSLAGSRNSEIIARVLFGAAKLPDAENLDEIDVELTEIESKADRYDILEAYFGKDEMDAMLKKATQHAEKATRADKAEEAGQEEEPARPKSKRKAR